MNNIISVLIISIGLMPISCGQTEIKSENQKTADQPIIQRENHSTSDSISILKAFEKLKSNKPFLKDLGLDNEKYFSWNDSFFRIIPGDLNGDGIKDVLLCFAMEGRGGGNNTDAHYAVFLNENNEWNYQTQLNAGSNWSERLTQLNEIKQGKISGNMIANKDENLPDIPVEFVFKNQSVINIYTGLHKTEIAKNENIKVSEIMTSDNKSIPLNALLTVYQQILGNGKIIEPKEQPACGTHFDEGHYSELHYPNLIFELNNNKNAACNIVTLKGSGLKLQTNKGTLFEKTTLNELKSILQNKDSLWIADEADGSKTLRIADGNDSDEQLHLLFDKNGSLVSVTFFVQC